MIWPWQRKQQQGNQLAGRPIIFMQAPPQEQEKTAADAIREMQEQNTPFDDSYRYMRDHWGMNLGQFSRAWTAIQREEKKNGWFV